MSNFRKFGVVTDEIDPENFEAALKVMKELGASYADLNTVGGKNISKHSKDEVSKMKRLLDAYEIKPMVLSTPFIKGISLDNTRRGEVANHAEFKNQLEVLRYTIELAHILGAPMLRTFSFSKDRTYTPPRGGEIDNDTFEKVVEGLRFASKVAAEEGIKLAMENVIACWGNSGYNMARIIRAVDSKALGAIWDVANAYVSGESPYPDGYEEVKDYICHVHVKDARIVNAKASISEWACMGHGNIDYQGQFKALAIDGYDGVITLETHWHPEGKSREQATRESFQGLINLIKQATRSE